MDAAFEQISPSIEFLEKPRLLNGTDTSALAAGTTDEIDLDLVDLYAGVDLLLVATYTAGTGGTLRVENPLSLITGIQIVAAGVDIHQSISAIEAYIIACILRGPNKAPYIARCAAIGSTTSLRATIPLDFTPLGLMPGHFGLLPSKYLSSLKLRITYATDLVAAIGYGVTGGSVTGTVTILKRTVLHETPAPQGYGTRMLYAGQTSVPTTNPIQAFKYEPGRRYAGFLVYCRDTANLVPSDAIFTGNATIYTDTTKRLAVNAGDIKDRMRGRFPQNFPGTSTQFNIDGAHYIDAGGSLADENGPIVTLANTLDATAAKEVKLELGLTAGTGAICRVTPIMLRGTTQSAAAMRLPVH